MRGSLIVDNKPRVPQPGAQNSLGWHYDWESSVMAWLHRVYSERGAISRDPSEVAL